MSPVPLNNRDDPSKDGDENEISDMETPQFIVPQGASDSEGEMETDDETDNNGYQLLPQEPNGETEQATAEEEEYASAGSITVDQVIMHTLDQEGLSAMGGSQFDTQDGDIAEIKERKEVWSSPRETEASSIEMTPDHVNAIRSAMAGFTLPSANQPDWARAVPEEEWKKQLISRLPTHSKHPTQKTPPDSETKR